MMISRAQYFTTLFLAIGILFIQQTNKRPCPRLTNSDVTNMHKLLVCCVCVCVCEGICFFTTYIISPDTQKYTHTLSLTHTHTLFFLPLQVYL